MNAQELLEYLLKMQAENIDLSKIDIYVDFAELVEGTGTIDHLAETVQKTVYPSTCTHNAKTLGFNCL
jgi:hypothetical protein